MLPRRNGLFAALMNSSELVLPQVAEGAELLVDSQTGWQSRCSAPHPCGTAVPAVLYQANGRAARPRHALARHTQLLAAQHSWREFAVAECSPGHASLTLEPASVSEPARSRRQGAQLASKLHASAGLGMLQARGPPHTTGQSGWHHGPLPAKRWKEDEPSRCVVELS